MLIAEHALVKFCHLKLNSNRIDIFIDAMDEHLMLNRNLIASHPYHFDSLTWCLQKNKPISLEKAMFRLCNDPVVYVTFFLHGLIVTFFSYFLQMFERHPKWDLLRISVNGFACYAGWSCTYRPTNNAHRLGAAGVYFGAFLFNNILLTFVLQCATATLFDPQVESIEQMIKNDYNLIGNEFAYRKIFELNQVKYIFISYD